MAEKEREIASSSARDMVIFTVAGVQRFISESRSTADLHAGSSLMSELAGAAVQVVEGRSGAVLVMPSGGSGLGVPNRIVALTPAETGASLGTAMADAVERLWRSFSAEAFGSASGQPAAVAGFPTLRWVCVPAHVGGYREQWRAALEALGARKRVRDFPAMAVPQARTCALTGRWAAVVERERPRGFNLRENEPLSHVGHVKRWYGRERGERFASTWSIASAPFRASVIAAAPENGDLWLAAGYLRDEVAALREAHRGRGRERAALGRGGGNIPGLPRSEDEVLAWLCQVEGAWCKPETWEPRGLRRDHGLRAEPAAALCGAGAAAAAALSRYARDAGLAPLTPYLAVLAQDADRMGKALSGFPGSGQDPLKWHQRVSAAVARVGAAQAEAIHNEHLGQVVYTGGDDLLALLPASTALAAARQVNGLLGDDAALRGLLARPSASSAVVFFHASWPLRSAIEAARGLLADAKRRGRPGLGVAVMNRGGERTRLVLPWRDAVTGAAMVTHLESLTADLTGSLSGRLASGLEEDRVALAELNREWRARELTRRAVRQGVPRDRAAHVGQALSALCGAEPGQRHVIDAANAVLVARFLAGARGGAADAQAGAA
ncbi:type III-B CRISPR-associated protein Cas10/Cmr2 [Actinomadura sp. NPDC023710]|uniref:type III-B CRISPR-associated protein Cas10/Cmr2 n=1 Tax=Actinomadura sp. NPDC023710 TaxID=3158219 RepID=UPI0033D3C76A